MTDFHIDATWKGVYKVGGLALVLADLFYLANCTLGFLMGSTPGNNLAFLQSLAAHPVLAQFIYWIYGLVDILFIPASLGLYLALKGINKNAMLIAAAILGFMIILDLGITELNTLALISLAQNYAAATSDAQRAVYLAAGNWGLATMPIATFFSWVGPSAEFLISSIVMLNSPFGRNTARLGIIVFSLGVICGFYFLCPVPFLGLLLIPVLLLYGGWLIAAGRRLFKLGRPFVEG